MLVQDITSEVTAMDERNDPTRRIWRLQYGPCWCRGVPGQTDSFDLMRMGLPEPIPGPFDANLLLISERLIDGSRSAVLSLVNRVPEPKVVVSLASCPATNSFWESLPGGWSRLGKLVEVDLEVTECVSGRPEVLLATVLGGLSLSRLSLTRR